MYVHDLPLVILFLQCQTPPRNLRSIFHYERDHGSISKVLNQQINWYYFKTVGVEWSTWFGKKEAEHLFYFCAPVFAIRSIPAIEHNCNFIRKAGAEALPVAVIKNGNIVPEEIT